MTNNTFTEAHMIGVIRTLSVRAAASGPLRDKEKAALQDAFLSMTQLGMLIDARPADPA